LSAGASPQTPLGELTAFLRPPSFDLRRPTSKGREEDGRGRGEERRGKHGRGKRNIKACRHMSGALKKVTVL